MIGPNSPDEARYRGRPDLTPLDRGPGSRLPRRRQWGDRLQGALVMLLGLMGLALAFTFMSGDPLLPQLGLPVPEDARASALLRPLSCLLPFIALGSFGLVAIGFNRVIRP